jgi:hypothetical protein
LVIYIFGYLTVQVSAATGNPALIGFLNKARMDMESGGWDALMARFDPMPPNYYVTSDVLGLIYHNPLVMKRLTIYPAFLSLSQMAEFKDLTGDADFSGMLKSEASPQAILDSSKIQALINQQAFADHLKEIDPQDLYTYLKTGKSPKYDDIPILGKWKVDVAGVIRQAKRKNPTISSEQLLMLKRVATTVLEGITLIATPEHQVFVKFTPTEALQKMQKAARDAQTAANGGGIGGGGGFAGGGGTSQMAQRYRNAAPPPPRSAQPSPPPNRAAPGDALKTYELAGQGTWEEKLGKYTLRIRRGSGGEEKMSGYFENGRLVISRGEGPGLVFLPTY